MISSIRAAIFILLAIAIPLEFAACSSSSESVGANDDAAPSNDQSDAALADVAVSDAGASASDASKIVIDSCCKRADVTVTKMPAYHADGK